MTYPKKFFFSHFGISSQTSHHRLRRRPIMKTRTLLLILGLAALVQLSLGDLIVVKEVVITPKRVPAAGNIGSVNQSLNIRMVDAEVSIDVGPYPTSKSGPLSIEFIGLFHLENESEDALDVTVGFPVSNSEYSSFEFKSFEAKTGETVRTVFNRTSGYPRRIQHAHVSGPTAESHKDLPDAELIERDEIQLMGIQKIGDDNYQNLMVWKESFAPLQKKQIEVRYVLEIPLQKNIVLTKKARGSYKGIWPQEANNLPVEFLKTFPEGREFFFFDYFLVSGASWKGPIGKEKITLRLDKSWTDHKLHCSIEDALRTEKTGSEEYAAVYSYSFKELEPTENLYFALEKK